MNVIDILEELESISSSNAKQEILEIHFKNEMLQTILKAALDPYVTYGISKFKQQKCADTSDGQTFEQFIGCFLVCLSTRKFTGNQAKDLAERHFSKMTEIEQKWAKRILTKNLRMGVQASIANRIWPNLIPVFKVQLAEPLDISIDENNKIIFQEPVFFPVAIEPKLDGIRCIAIKKNGAVFLFGRSGKQIDTVPKIVKALEEADVDNVVFDGELMARNWEESMSIFGSKKNMKDDTHLFFNIFDSLTIEEWISNKCERIYTDRVKEIENSIKIINSIHIRQVETTIINGIEELVKNFSKFLDQGYEGLMLKKLEGFYTFKRSDDFIKMKPVSTHEGFVVGIYSGAAGSRNQEVAGGINILGSNGVVTKCGGGFSDEDRFNLKMMNDLIGRIAEVQGQGLTPEGKIRFPVFLRWRNINDIDQKLIEIYEQYKTR